MHELDCMCLRCRLVSHESKSDRVEAHEPLSLSDGLADGRRDKGVIKDGERFILEQIAGVCFHEVQKFFARKRFNGFQTVHLMQEVIVLLINATYNDSASLGHERR